MTYSELLHRTPFEEIVPHMTFLRNNKDALVKEYAELYNRLLEIEPQKSNYHIVIVDRWEGTSPDIDMTCTIRNMNDDSRCVLGRYMELNELLGMEIEVEEDVSLSEPELLAGLFWEMSKCHLFENDKEHLAILKAWGIKEQFTHKKSIE